MKVFVTGGTGAIGRRLVEKLKERGDHPVVLSRQADRARLLPALRDVDVVQGDPCVAGGWQASLGRCDAVVNLAGHNIFAQKWNADVKRLVRLSRLHATENVVAAIAGAAQKPRVLVQGSAIGYYGHRGDDVLDESSGPGDDFMAQVCRDWESAAMGAEALGTRVARIRIGVVLSRRDGALAKMEPIFRFVPGGAAPVGSDGRFAPARGLQWMSWIHLEDIVGILLLALDRNEASGPINGTAPEPVRNAEFSKELAQAMRGRFWPVYVKFGPPDFLLGLALGEVAQVITRGQRVLPKRATELGYSFQFPSLASALANLYPRSRAAAVPQPALAARAGS
jgi:uncharacterized protein